MSKNKGGSGANEFWLCNSDHTLAEFIAEIPTIYEGADKYVTFQWTTGKDRTTDQNSLAWQCYIDLHKARSETFATVDDARSHCKLYHGIPLMLAQDEKYLEAWYRMIKDRFTTEEKLDLMLEPFNYPVTSMMKRETFSKWVDRLYAAFPDVPFRALREADNGKEA